MANEFKVHKGLIINDTTAVDGILDEDTMSSDSATALATQQSIKAYADSVGSRPITQRLTVGQAGSNVDYNSIASAVTAAISGGASATSIWEIQVYPGVYVESAMTIPQGVVVKSSDNRIDSVFVVALDAANDLFTMTGGFLCGIHISGVTTATKALVRCSTAATLNLMIGITFHNCAVGVAVSNGATVVMDNTSVLISGASQGITTGVEVVGTGSTALISGFLASVPSAVLPLYAGNPVQCMLDVDSSGELYLSGGTFRIAPKDATADVVCVNGSSAAFVVGVEFSGCGNALHIGSTGTNSEIITQGCSFKNNTLNIYIESSTGTIYSNETVDATASSIVAGGKHVGLVQYRDVDRVRLLGDVDYRFINSDRDVSFGNYFAELGSTGVVTGGGVTNSTGLTVDVAAGTGWVRRGSTFNDLEYVSWSSSSGLTLTASSTNYVFYNATSDAIEDSTTPPGYEDKILLATVVTNVTGIRYNHQTRNYILAPFEQLRTYLLTTRKLALSSGLAVTDGGGVNDIDIGSGSYYLGLDSISYAGATTASFSYFYGTNGANEVASQTSLSDTQYDSSGTLTNLTASYYKADTVFLTSDGRVSVVYGTAEYATQTDAEEAPQANMPTFIEESAIPLANVVLQESSGIISVVDLRPQPAIGGTGGGGGAGGVTDHGALSGLGDDDHVQYLLADGSRSMSGSLNMGANAITNVGNVDGVDVSSHASRHNPGGLDAIALGTPVAVSPGVVPAEGTATSFSRSDHQHGATVGNLTENISSVLTITGGSNALWGSGTAIEVGQADAVNAGYLSSTDWSTFNGKSDYTDPLTTNGDVLVRSAGTTTRLPVGTNDQILTVVAGAVAWAAAPAGFSDPMTTRGDLIYRDATNTTTRLGRGTANQVLQSDGTDISWQTLTASDVSDFQATVSLNTDVAANTAARHDAVTLNASATTGGLSLSVQEISFQAATGAQNGYLTSTDWSTFNNKSDYTDPLTTRGDLLYRNATITTRLSLGTSGQVLSSNGTDVLWSTLSASDVGALADIVEDTTPQLGGDLDLNENYIELNSAPTVDLTGNGWMTSETVDTNTTGIGAALYMAADGHYDEADADATTTMPVVALALETGTGTKQILRRGFIRNDTWNWTLGNGVANYLYASTTTGGLTQTAPSATGDLVQIVGYAVSADVIYFDPQLVMVEVA